MACGRGDVEGKAGVGERAGRIAPRLTRSAGADAAPNVLLTASYFVFALPPSCLQCRPVDCFDFSPVGFECEKCDPNSIRRCAKCRSPNQVVAIDHRCRKKRCEDVFKKECGKPSKISTGGAGEEAAPLRSLRHRRAGCGCCWHRSCAPRIKLFLLPRWLQRNATASSWCAPCARRATLSTTRAW